MAEATAAWNEGRGTPASPGRAPAADVPPGDTAPTVLEVLRRLGSGPRGLTETEAEERTARSGENRGPTRRDSSWTRLFVRSLRDPFTAVLTCLGLVSAAVTAWGTASVILLLVLVSCALRASGEHRADRSTAALRELVATTATVVRRPDERSAPAAREIPVDALVPGDIIRLGPGDLVPADVRLLRSVGLTVHQAALTGESAPVAKCADDLPGSTADPSRTLDGMPGTAADPSRTFDGMPGTAAGLAGIAAGPTRTATRLAKSSDGLPTTAEDPPGTAADPTTTPDDLPGTAHAPAGAAGGGVLDPTQLCFQGSSIVSGSATAVVTATGARTRFAEAHDRTSSTPRTSAFDRSVHGISWFLIRFMLLPPPLVLMANAALRGRGLETLPFAVAVAVGLTPEMLPVLVTLCLARGAAPLARAHGVIVRRLPALHDLGAVDVLCVDKTGTLTQDRPVVDRALGPDGRDDPGVLHWAAVSAWWTLQLGDLPRPDALDEAILDAADEDELTAYDGVAAVPFAPDRRHATAVVRTPGRLGTHTLAVKGDVSSVLTRCAVGDDERERLLALAARHAGTGARVLAVATAERAARGRPYTPAEVRGLTFLGLITLRDALAPTAAGALEVLTGRGVEVKVLTGDHPGTAVRACLDLGVPVAEDAVLTAEDMDALTAAELVGAAARTTVFARCTPDHKARITEALRGAGHTVGFLGDGVNDLPALRTADVGIAPRGAADVVRDAADLVLAEKDLGAVAHAVDAGRRAGDNIATYLRVTLSSNLGNVLAMLCAGLLLPFLPMLPAQVLAQNLCFDAAQLSFARHRPHPRVPDRPTVLDPRRLLRFITGFGVLNAVADLATFGILAPASHGPGTGNGEAVFHGGWFTENLLTQAAVMVVLSVGRRPALSRRAGPVVWAATALAAVGLALPFSPLGPALGLAAPPAVYYPLLGAVLSAYAGGLLAVRAARKGVRPHVTPGTVPPQGA
ncbi:cation-translocating P-type ATPase, partial [Streptomyces aureus]|uniref:cation-translocating P-type ATPase n=1 Tax=Streptomyces aureus TaxID=193461 RepID=UPI0033E94E47